jgi:hypothetical protein
MSFLQENTVILNRRNRASAACNRVEPANQCLTRNPFLSRSSPLSWAITTAPCGGWKKPMLKDRITYSSRCANGQRIKVAQVTMVFQLAVGYKNAMRIKQAYSLRRVISGAASLLLAGMLVVTPATAWHKFHASITQMDYNAKAQAIEAVTRFFLDDFETAVSRHAQREIKFSTPAALKDKANSAAVLAYVRERLEVKSAQGVAVKFTLVGMEMQGDMIWVYYEGKHAGGLGKAQVRCRWLHELYEDQVNIVNYKYEGQSSGTMFNVQDGFKIVPPKK